MRRLLVAVVVAASSLVPAAAMADVTSASPVFMPIPTALTLKPLFGEPTGTGGALAPALAVLPLRLSMLGSAFPLAGSLPSDPFHCDPDASGNAQNGFAVEHEVFLAMTSRLALHGFSRLGCPVDALVGGAATYTLPLGHDLWLATSAGAYARSSVLQGQVRPRTEARVDLLMKTGDGRTLGVGVGQRGRRSGVAITGTW